MWYHIALASPGQRENAERSIADHKGGQYLGAAMARVSITLQIIGSFLLKALFRGGFRFLSALSQKIPGKRSNAIYISTSHTPRNPHHNLICAIPSTT